jgi:hypothetical protein
LRPARRNERPDQSKTEHRSPRGDGRSSSSLFSSSPKDFASARAPQAGREAVPPSLSGWAVLPSRKALARRAKCDTSLRRRKGSQSGVRTEDSEYPPPLSFPVGVLSLLSPRCVVGMRISRHSSSRPGRRPCFQAPKRPGTAFRVGQAARGRPSGDPSESAFKAIGRSNQAVSRATSHLESSGGSHSDRNFDRAAGGRESEGGGRSNGDGLRESPWFSKMT